MKFGFQILYSGFQSPGIWIPQGKNSKIPDSTIKHFLDSGICIPLYKAITSILKNQRTWFIIQFWFEPTSSRSRDWFSLKVTGTFQAVVWGRDFIKTTWNPQSLQKAGWSKIKVTVTFYLALLTSDVTTSRHWWPSGVRWSKLVRNKKLKLTVNSKEHNHPMWNHHFLSVINFS